MLRYLKNLPVIQSIMASIAVVLVVVMVPVVAIDVLERRQEVDISATRAAMAALDMLESVHVQAMLNRKQTPDGDPAIETLNGTMTQFSDSSNAVRLWLVMGQKVIDYQLANGQSEVEGPLDDIDRRAIGTKLPIAETVGDEYRMSRPVILGTGHASDGRCAACHTALMGIADGEVVGGYSAAVDIAGPMADWRFNAAKTVLLSGIALIAVLAATYALLKFGALRPLESLSRATRTLAQGDTDVTIELAGRPDSIGSMARSLEVFRDGLISQRQLEIDNDRTHRELTHLASHDPLTNLPNRSGFRDAFDEALAAARSDGEMVAVLAIDLDHFKDVNDSLGHAAGDKLLQIVSDRLRGIVAGKGFAGRIGGDEFVLVRTGVEGTDEIEDMCREILHAYEHPIELEGIKIPVGLSIGIAMSGTDGTDSEVLLRNADTALYSAKEDGRRTFRFFAPDMNLELKARREMERDLRNAIVDDGLHLNYQPLVDVASGRIIGVEALMRWTHPEKGNIPPSDFIPIAETSGLIIPMGRWLLQKACSDAVNWPSIVLSVNLSPVQFKDKNLVEFIGRTLEEVGMDPAMLEIEITEGVLMVEQDEPLRILNEIRALGVRVAMDDFGTGYSSLGYLSSFPFDKIKIDRSFVMKLETDVNAQAIVRSVVGLGRNLGMTTTAEGVENAEQLSFLQTEGCDQVQGYLMAKPQSALSVTALMSGWKPVEGPEATRLSLAS